MYIVKNNFNFKKIKYYDWDKSSQYGKTTNYKDFLGDTLIHVEDESIHNKEARYCLSLSSNFHYLSVTSWFPHHAWDEEFKEYGQNDEELIVLLDKIKKIFLI